MLAYGGASKSGTPSSSKPTFKDILHKTTGTQSTKSLVAQVYIVESARKTPQLELSDPLITRIHEAYAAREALSTGLMDCGHEQWIYSNGSIIHGQRIVRYLFAPRVSTIYFHNNEDYQGVFECGSWFWGRSKLFITPWMSDFDPNLMSVTRTPVWIKLLDLPLHF